MTTKNTKILACRVSVDTYNLFAQLAKVEGLTPGEHLKNIIIRGLERKGGGVNPVKDTEIRYTKGGVPYHPVAG